MMDPNRRRWAALVLMAGLAGAAPLAQAQAFPNKPVRIVVPYAAGGPSDMVTRAVGQRMSQFLGVPVVVDNRAGANAVIGMEHVARSPGDGYTLVMFSLGGSVLNTVTRDKLPYDLMKDFRPVGNMATLAQVVAGANAIPARTMAEFVAHAKANPGKVSYGSSGTGGTPHLLGEWIKVITGIDMVHAPYKGTGPATTDLIAGHIHLLITELPVLIEHIRDGKIRALAISTKARSPLLPNVPTVEESGFPQLTGSNWFGLGVPASTPDDVVARLNDALNKALTHPETRAAMLAQGADPDPGPPERYGKLMRDELVRWTTVVRDTKVQVK